MLDHARQRTDQLRAQMRVASITTAVFTDESSIAYLAGFWGYLGVEFGRPTFLVVHADDDPTMKGLMARSGPPTCCQFVTF